MLGARLLRGLRCAPCPEGAPRVRPLRERLRLQCVNSALLSSFLVAPLGSQEGPSCSIWAGPTRRQGVFPFTALIPQEQSWALNRCLGSCTLQAPGKLSSFAKGCCVNSCPAFAKESSLPWGPAWQAEEFGKPHVQWSAAQQTPRVEGLKPTSRIASLCSFECHLV